MVCWDRRVHVGGVCARAVESVGAEEGKIAVGGHLKGRRVKSCGERHCTEGVYYYYFNKGGRSSPCKAQRRRIGERDWARQQGRDPWKRPLGRPGSSTQERAGGAAWMWVGSGNAAGRMLGYRQRLLASVSGGEGRRRCHAGWSVFSICSEVGMGGAGVRRGWEDDPEKGEHLQQSCSVPCVECVGVGVRMGVGYVV